MLPWQVNGETIGFHRPVPAPQTIWLMLHGNGGQASDRTYVLPVRLMLRDRWDNIAALRNYAGPVEIYAAIDDEIIPFAHAKNLSVQIPTARFTAIEGGHNSWSASPQVKISR